MAMCRGCCRLDCSSCSFMVELLPVPMGGIAEGCKFFGLCTPFYVVGL